MIHAKAGVYPAAHQAQPSVAGNRVLPSTRAQVLQAGAGRLPLRQLPRLVLHAAQGHRADPHAQGPGHPQPRTAAQRGQGASHRPVLRRARRLRRGPGLQQERPQHEEVAIPAAHTDNEHAIAQVFGVTLPSRACGKLLEEEQLDPMEKEERDWQPTPEGECGKHAAERAVAAA